MLSVTNYGAACCVIEGQGIRILCDPWFTDGIYLGAWERDDYITDPITTIGEVDYIWISHLHEDHYDLVFLRSYCAAYPKAQIMTGSHSDYLIRIMRRDGIAANHCQRWGSKYWEAATIANSGYPNDIDNIDSALVVTDFDSVVINMNDCPFDQGQVDAINRITQGKRVTALLPYAGDGPWPQCYHMPSTACLAAAGDKKRHYLDQFQRYRAALHADVAIPFAAGYRLRGKLADLNAYRGIPKPDEVQGATVLPVTGSSPRPANASANYVWEDLPLPSNDEIESLLRQASERSPKVDGDALTIDLNWGPSAAYIDATAEPAKTAHETITLDSRLLHGLLTRKWHWNSAEISSVLRIKRHGRAYDPRVFDYLFRFHT